MPLLRWFSIGYIELIRGVPLISVLFMASVMLPLFLPQGVSIDKLLRAQLAMILFAAAYLAEVIRGDKDLNARTFQVAGHTDNKPLAGGPYKDNWGLSVMRAREVLSRSVSVSPPQRSFST